MSRFVAECGLAVAVLLVGCGQATLTPLRPDGGEPPDAQAWVDDCTDEDVVRERVFGAHCATSDCHDSDRPRAELDLESPGIGPRLLAATSIHDECAGRPLVVPGVARASFLIDKVIANEGECGDPMPLEEELPLEARRCLVQWIDSLP